MKKLVKVLAFALCLPFAMTFTACGGDDEVEIPGGGNQGGEETPVLAGTLFTLDGKPVTSSTLEFTAMPVPELLALGFTELKACTTPFIQGTDNHLQITNATNSEKAIKVTVTLLQEKSPTVTNISWCGIVQGCADIRNMDPVVREATLAANSSVNLDLDAIFTEGIYEDCSMKVELEVAGQATETIIVKFVYAA